MPIQFRPAVMSDTDAMLEIYAGSVTNSHISFETAVPSLLEYQERFRKISEKYPWWVATVDGRIAGFTYAGLFRERAAYAWALETSIYIHPDFQKFPLASVKPQTSIAQHLYEILFRELKTLGIKQVIGVIALPNAASVRFHEKCGFKPVGTFRSIGFKMEKWWDVIFMNRFLTESNDD